MVKHSHNGLSFQEVQFSRKQHGSNRLTTQKRLGFAQQFLANFGDPIIKVLLIALVINVLFLFRHHDWYESIGIAVAILAATLVSTISEYGSESAFEKLKQQSENTKSRVRRNGQTVCVHTEDLVVGDIVLLQAGESVPADGILLEGEISVDQSALNGESKEVTKIPTPSPSDDVLLCQNRLTRGSLVCSGEGVFRVETVGDHTFYGRIARDIQEQTRESPLKKRLENLAQNLSKIGFIAAIAVGITELFRSFVLENQFQWASILASLSSPSVAFGNILHALILAITVIVVAVPEGLPMMITVVLSSNMRRMLKDQVLVRKLVGIETSGSINILFTDKTGTITKGKPEVSAFLCGDGKEADLHRTVRKTPLWEMLSLSGYYNTECEISGRSIIGGNATDKALLSYIRGKHPFNTNCSVIKHQLFDSEHKWSGVELCGEFFTPSGCQEQKLSFVKGAPDLILSKCTRYMDSNGTLYPFSLSQIQQAKNKLESQAMRMIAIAVTDHPIDTLPGELILLGIAGLRDELRSDVKKSVSLVKQAGIQTVIVTGDSRETAMAIAYCAGILSGNEQELVLTSAELAAMTDEQIKKELPNLRIVARALPSDKSRLVRLAQEENFVVGMTGDGVNDAPAMKKADVGFAMGSGSEIAKQAGDIIILDNRFSSICKAILYGRTIFKSIRKFIVFQLTMNVGAVGISIIGPLLGVDMPVTVMQMLWINMIMDTLAGLAFAGEAPLTEYMSEPPKRREENILNRYMINQILCGGIFTVTVCSLFLSLPFFKALFSAHWMTAFFALFVFLGVFNSFNTRTTRLNLFAHLRKNKAFIGISILIVIVQIGLIYYGGSLFRTEGLTFIELGMVVLIALLIIPFDWCRKAGLRLFHRKGTL